MEQEIKTNKRAVVLLSGGLDSTTVAAIAKSEGRELFALTIDYNQRHKIELQAAKNVAEYFEIQKHVILPLDLRIFGGSSLTDSWEVPKNVPLEQIGKSIPNTYVPARNTVFLSLALAFAESVAAQEIYIGVSAIDSSGYPDCRPDFLASFEQLANLATKFGLESRQKGTEGFRIRTPLLALSKTETIKYGLSLGVDYALTWTCYDPDESGLSCGVCESCLLRLHGFQGAGVDDPLPYRCF